MIAVTGKCKKLAPDRVLELNLVTEQSVLGTSG
jgi:hypothetical protein